MNINIENKSDYIHSFEIPTDYFGSLYSRIIDKKISIIQSEVSMDLLTGKSLGTPNDDYFANNISRFSNLDLLASTVPTSPEYIVPSSLQAPDQYFNSKSSKISEPTKSFPKKENNVYPLYSNWRIASNIAASFLVLVAIGWAFFNIPSKSSHTDTSNVVSNHEWNQFLEEEQDLIKESEGKDPLVNLDHVPKTDIEAFLNDEKYLELF